MAKQAQKIGPRVTVVFGSVTVEKPGNKSGKGRGIQYVYMRKATADFFGLKPAPNAVGKAPAKGGTARPVKGAKGSGSIKIPVGSGVGATNAVSKGKGKVVYKAIPVPSGATIAQIRKFISTFAKNKPVDFVTKGGQTWPVQSLNSKGK
ncbi:hypothetical protein [Anabaena catenula]|uniref:CpcD n=1 Tax=Anabaena catenula FACHB-362 TaxID=2692877 RepID=A0ABR8J6I3_9NOST|nr:hypothetical protein [Anabaena catenula]MBD2692636.1 hypothetical protein [Anabaena catenula FACHB-362]